MNKENCALKLTDEINHIQCLKESTSPDRFVRQLNPVPQSQALLLRLSTSETTIVAFHTQLSMHYTNPHNLPPASLQTIQTVMPVWPTQQDYVYAERASSAILRSVQW